MVNITNLGITRAGSCGYKSIILPCKGSKFRSKLFIPLHFQQISQQHLSTPPNVHNVLFSANKCSQSTFLFLCVPNGCLNNLLWYLGEGAAYNVGNYFYAQ